MVATRRDGLMVQTVHDEVLVFHPARNEASALNRSAAVVFELCDGDHTVDQIRQALDDAGLGPSSDDAVWLALTELADADLIELSVPPAEHLGRRELLKKLGVGAAAAAAALPVVETIGAPSAAAQGSGPDTGGGAGGAGGTGGTTVSPTISTNVPTVSPTFTTNVPTVSPTGTNAPTVSPTFSTNVPTVSPTFSTNVPTVSPTFSTNVPTMSPTLSPTVSPTIFTPAPTTVVFPPTLTPTVSPTPIV